MTKVAVQTELTAFAWLAGLAFLAGFIAYLLVSAPVIARVYEAAPHAAASETGAQPVSGPVSQEWNLRKSI